MLAPYKTKALRKKRHKGHTEAYNEVSTKTPNSARHNSPE
jgi:hypothetical protein